MSNPLNAQPLTQDEQALVTAARLVGAYPNKVPWSARALLRFSAAMLLSEREHIGKEDTE